MRLTTLVGGIGGAVTGADRPLPTYRDDATSERTELTRFVLGLAPGGAALDEVPDGYGATRVL